MINRFKATSRKNREFRNQIRSIKKPSSSDSDSDFDIDKLVSEVQRINLSSSNQPENTMAEVNYSEVRLFLDIIPIFNGEPCELNNFIAACDEAVNRYTANQVITKLIFRGIIGKLKSKALTIISSRVELTTWQQVKEVLKISFCDQRSFSCLLQELHQIKPQNKENSYSFGIRCQYLRSLIFSSINNDTSLLQPEKLAQINNIEKLILITFQKYLPSQVQLAVRLKNPTNLEQAMQFLIEEENFLSLANEGRKNLSNINHVVQNAPRPNQFNSVSHNFPKPNFNAPFMQNSFPQNENRRFPSQPINITPRQLPPPKYFSNQQVFGKPTNVWKPKGTIQPKPTPMSVVTKQTVQKPSTSFYRSPNHFQPQSRSTFISEELHNFDNEYFDYNEYVNYDENKVEEAQISEIQEFENASETQIEEQFYSNEDNDLNFQETASSASPT